MLKRDNAYVIKQQLASYLGDLKSQQLFICGDHFRFIEGGQVGSECIVFLHGTMGNKSQWRGLMQLLSNHYHVIAIDVPGLAVGFKTEEDHYSLTALSNYLHRFLSHRNISSLSLVGHSMGANVACRYAALNPDRINSLILSSLTGWEQLFGQSYWQKFSEFKQMLVFNSLEEFKDLASSLFYQPPYMPKVLLDFRMRDVQRHRTQLFKVLDDMQQEFYFLPEDLRSLSCAVLAINGEKDVFVDQAAVKRATNNLPGIEIVHFGNCGHVPFLEFPKKTHEVIKSFIVSRTHSLEVL